MRRVVTALLLALAKLQSCALLEDEAPPAATQLVGQMEVLVPLAGLIDVAAERDRLSRELEKLTREIARLSAKLDNAAFVEKAPQEVVDRERAKLDEANAAAGTLRLQMQRLEDIGS